MAEGVPEASAMLQTEPCHAVTLRAASSTVAFSSFTETSPGVAVLPLSHHGVTPWSSERLKPY